MPQYIILKIFLLFKFYAKELITVVAHTLIAYNQHQISHVSQTRLSCVYPAF